MAVILGGPIAVAQELYIVMLIWGNIMGIAVGAPNVYKLLPYADPNRANFI